MRTAAHHTLSNTAKRGKTIVPSVDVQAPVIPQHKQKIVHFCLDQLRYALPVSDVLTIERAVSITPVSKAPASVAGVINFHGDIIPVFDLRKLFGLPAREVRLEDRFIIAHTSQRLVALVADSVAGVCDHDGRDTSTANAGGSKHLSGIVTKDHGTVLLADLESILSPDEQLQLEQAIAKGQK